MSEQSPELPKPEYNFTAEELQHANAGDTEAIVNDYIETYGGYPMSEEDSQDAFVAGMVLDDEARGHAASVQKRAEQMYEDAYAEHEQRTGGENETAGL